MPDKFVHNSLTRPDPTRPVIGSGRVYCVLKNNNEAYALSLLNRSVRWRSFLLRLSTINHCVGKNTQNHLFSAAKGWVKEVSQQQQHSAEADATSAPPSKGTGSAAAAKGKGKGKSSTTTRGHTPQSASRRAYAVLEAAQAEAARQIIQGADVVVCSCIGAGNDAFVRAIGGDQEG